MRVTVSSVSRKEELLADSRESQGLHFIFVGRYKLNTEANVIREEEMRTNKRR